MIYIDKNKRIFSTAPSKTEKVFFIGVPDSDGIFSVSISDVDKIFTSSVPNVDNLFSIGIPNVDKVFVHCVPLESFYAIDTLGRYARDFVLLRLAGAWGFSIDEIALQTQFEETLIVDLNGQLIEDINATLIMAWQIIN